MLKAAWFFNQWVIFLILTLTGTGVQSSDESHYGPVNSKETLWDISLQVKPDEDLSNTQVAVSIFQRNLQAFRYNNMNGLKQGQMLIIPSAEEMHSISKQQADKMLQQQWKEWKNGTAQSAGQVETVPSELVIVNQSSADTDINENSPHNTTVSDVNRNASYLSLKEKPLAVESDISHYRSQDNIPLLKPGQNTGPVQPQAIGSVSKVPEKKPVIESNDNISLTNSTHIPESDRMTHDLPDDEPISQVIQQTEELIAYADRVEHAADKQPKYLNKALVDPIDQSVVEKPVAIDFFSHIKIRMDGFLKDKGVLKEGAVYFFGLIAILLILYLLVRKEQTYPRIKLFADEYVDGKKVTREMLNPEPLIEVTKRKKISQEKVNREHRDSSIDIIENDLSGIKLKYPMLEYMTQQSDNGLVEQEMSEIHLSVEEDSAINKLTEAELLSAVTSRPENTIQHANTGKNTHTGYSTINDITEAELLSAVDSKPEKNTQQSKAGLNKKEGNK